MRASLVAFIAGLIFSFGLILSGMTQAVKIVGFLDVFGRWDPSLLFVIVSAICVYAIAFKFILRKRNPILADKFYVPTNKVIDKKLVIGAAIFGIGWGLSGYCPGPAIVSLVSGVKEILIFFFSVVVGIYLAKYF